MSFLPPFIPAWLAPGVGIALALWMLGKVARQLPVDLRHAVINWRALTDEVLHRARSETRRRS